MALSPATGQSAGELRPAATLPDAASDITSLAAFPSGPFLAASSASTKTNIFIVGISDAASSPRTLAAADQPPVGAKLSLLSTVSLPHPALHLAFSPSPTTDFGAHDLLSSSLAGKVLHLRVTPGRGSARPTVEWLREIPCFPAAQPAPAKPGKMAPSSRVRRSAFLAPDQASPLSFAAISGPLVATWDLHRAAGAVVAPLSNPDDQLLGLCTVPAHPSLVGLSSAEGTVLLLDLRAPAGAEPGQPASAVAWQLAEAHGPRSVPALAFASRGPYLATGGEDGTVKVWDVRFTSGAGSCVASSGREGAGGRVTDIAWSASHPHVLTFSSLDRSVRTLSILPAGTAPPALSHTRQSLVPDADADLSDADGDAEEPAAEGKWMDDNEAAWWSYIRGAQSEVQLPGVPMGGAAAQGLAMHAAGRDRLPSAGAPSAIATHPMFPYVFAAAATGEVYALRANPGRPRIPRPREGEKEDPRLAALRAHPAVAQKLLARDAAGAAAATMAAFAGGAKADEVAALVSCLPGDGKAEPWRPGERGAGDPAPEFASKVAAWAAGLDAPPAALPASLAAGLAAIRLRAELEDKVAAGKWEAVAKRAREVVASVEAEFAEPGWEVPVWTGEALKHLVSPVIQHDLLRGASLAARLAQIIHSSSLPTSPSRFRTLAPLLHLALYPTVFDPVPAPPPGTPADQGPETPRAHWDEKQAGLRRKAVEERHGAGGMRPELAELLGVGELAMPMLKLEIALLKLVAKGPGSSTGTPPGTPPSAQGQPSGDGPETDAEIVRLVCGGVHHHSPVGEGMEPERTVSLTANRLYLDAMLRLGRWEGYWDHAVDLLAVSAIRTATRVIC
ncbi:WD40-repeat-containing domain protein [Hyaloraphidium curvatum]|nr:WD40-repeat-containing domain protein [Hyaloraphidium curvatum]